MRSYIEAYLREKPFFFSLLRPKEASLYQSYKPFKRPILDIGCGDGFFAQVAFKKVDVGIDVDSKSLKEARRRKVYLKIKHYGGRRIPYPDGYFSTILCNSTFEHIPNLDEVLNEVSRVSKKGGMLYFTVPTNMWPKYLFGTFLLGRLYEMIFNKVQRHQNLYSLKTWSRSLSKVGFNVTSYTYYLDNKRILWFFDIGHYLSVTSLITKRLFNRWVLFPGKTRYLRKLASFIEKETQKDTKMGSCVFIVAEKVK